MSLSNYITKVLGIVPYYWYPICKLSYRTLVSLFTDIYGSSAGGFFFFF